MKKGNLDNFIQFLEEQVLNHSIYVWGGDGRTGSKVTEYYIRKREQNTGGTKVNGEYKTYADIAVEFWKKQCELGYHDVLGAFDCSGLLVKFLLDNKLIQNDMTANSLMRLCEETDEPKRGYWLFRVNADGRATHIGVMVSDSEYIHAKGRAYGVVREKLSEHKNYWHKYGKPKMFDFEDEPQPTPTPTKSKYVHPKGSVRVREGNGTQYKQIKPTANKKDFLPMLGQDTESPYWYLVEWQGRNGYITSKSRYTEVVEK